MEILKLYEDKDLVIVQDDIKINAGEFKSICNKIAGYVVDKFKNEKVIGVISDNDVYGLLLAVGAACAGKDVLPLSTFNQGLVNEYLIKQTGCKSFIGYGTDLDHSNKEKIHNLKNYKLNYDYGNFIVSSTGSTGIPKISCHNMLDVSPEYLTNLSELLSSKIPNMDKKIFYSAPLMGGITVYLSMISVKFIPYLTNQRPSTNLINEMIAKNNLKICSGRPTLIERFINEDIQSLYGAEALISSGAPLSEKQIEYCQNVLGIKYILDLYATTEAGTIGARDAIREKTFSILPETSVFDIDSNGFKIKNTSIRGSYSDKNFYSMQSRYIDDEINYFDNQIKLVGRASKKIKVSGFSVPMELIKQAVENIPGIVGYRLSIEASESSSDLIALKYTGKKYKDDEIISMLKQKLPFYSIPKKIYYIPADRWGITK